MCCLSGKDSQVEVLNEVFEDPIDDNTAIDSVVASACNEDDGVEGKPGGVLGCGETGELGAAFEPGGVNLEPCLEVGEVF